MSSLVLDHPGGDVEEVLARIAAPRNPVSYALSIS
jgi:hypothetical protein